MQIPPVVSFRDVEPSPELEAEILERVGKLERFHDRIIGCRVVVSVPHKSQRSGRLYDVRIELALPGEEIVVNRENGPDLAHAEPRVAIRDAFQAARRELVDHVARARDRAHAPPGERAAGPESTAGEAFPPGRG